MKTEKVDKRYVIRLTESEAKVLEKRFALSGMSSVSAYLRQQVVSRIYKQELYELQEGVTEIWQQLQSIQSELQKINPSSIS